MGFSYLAAIFVPGVAPIKLYHEAFSSLHRRKNLTPITIEMQSSPSPVVSTPPPSSGGLDPEEAESLIGKES